MSCRSQAQTLVVHSAAADAEAADLRRRLTWPCSTQQLLKLFNRSLSCCAQAERLVVRSTAAEAEAADLRRQLGLARAAGAELSQRSSALINTANGLARLTFTATPVCRAWLGRGGWRGAGAAQQHAADGHHQPGNP